VRYLRELLSLALSREEIAGVVVWPMLAPCGGDGSDSLPPPNHAVCSDDPAASKWWNASHVGLIELCAKGCAIRDNFALYGSTIAQPALARWHVKSSAAKTDDTAGRIRWITNRYLYIGNVAWFKAHTQLLGGTIPCCAGFGVTAKGGFLQYDTPAQIQAYTLPAPYTGIPVLPNIGMSLSTTVGDAAMLVLTTDLKALSAFADACVTASVVHNLTGLMIDYEPVSATVTAADYAEVIRVITVKMHAHGKQFGVFLAGWGILGNWSAYKDCGADLFATMDYYPTGGSPGTPVKVDAILSAGIPAANLSIGMATTGWNQSSLRSYLAYVKSRFITQIDVWWCPPTKNDPRVNISSAMVDALESFVHGPKMIKTDDGVSAMVGAALLVTVAGHGAVVLPRPRNAIDGALPPWSRGFNYPVPTPPLGQAGACPIANRTSDHNSGLSGALGQACFFFSNGCSIGCPSCDGVTRGPIPCTHATSGCRGCKAMHPPGEDTCQRKMDTCGLNKSATICGRSLRTLNIDAPCGSETDWYYYSPWRSPGSAPVLDACGVAGGAPKQAGFGAQYKETQFAKQGDRRSQLPSTPHSFNQPEPAEGSQPWLWTAGTHAEVSWAIAANRKPVAVAAAVAETETDRLLPTQTEGDISTGCAQSCKT
jgi:hypothetical protein